MQAPSRVVHKGRVSPLSPILCPTRQTYVSELCARSGQELHPIKQSWRLSKFSDRVRTHWRQTSRKSNRHGFDVRATLFAPLGAEPDANERPQPIPGAEVDLDHSPSGERQALYLLALAWCRLEIVANLPSMLISPSVVFICVPGRKQLRRVFGTGVCADALRPGSFFSSTCRLISKISQLAPGRDNEKALPWSGTTSVPY